MFKISYDQNEEIELLINVDSINYIKPATKRTDFNSFIQFGKENGYFVTNSKEEIKSILEIE